MPRLKPRAWFKMEKQADDAEISIFDEIDSWWGIGPKDFKAALDGIKGAKSIKLLMNSPGGSVFDGMAIYNMLTPLRDKLTVEVIGLAASIASVIALAGSKLVVAEGAYYMIHNPWTRMSGDAEELRKAAELLDKMRDDYAAIYADRSGLELTEVKEMMDAETWLSASEAVEKGFADETSDYGQVAARVSAERFGFAHVPAALTESVDRDTIETERELEALLRDAGGFSKREAATIAGHGWRALSRGDPDGAARDLALLARERELDFESRRMQV